MDVMLRDGAAASMVDIEKGWWSWSHWKEQSQMNQL
jgi:hypothetical protein